MCVCVWVRFRTTMGNWKMRSAQTSIIHPWIGSHFSLGHIHRHINRCKSISVMTLWPLLGTPGEVNIWWNSPFWSYCSAPMIDCSWVDQIVNKARTLRISLINLFPEPIGCSMERFLNGGNDARSIRWQVRKCVLRTSYLWMRQVNILNCWEYLLYKMLESIRLELCARNLSVIRLLRTFSSGSL